MPAAQELAVIFKVVDQASPVLRAVGGKVKAFSAKARASIGKVGKAVFNLKTAFIALGVFAAVRIAKQFVENYKNQIFALTRLNAAMRASGMFTQEASDQLRGYATAMQATTTFTDDAILAASAMLATFKLSADTIEELTEITLDMAAATGMDLRAAAILMGKAAVGVTGELSRYGIIIDRVEYANRGLAVVMEEVRKEFGGTAKALRETPIGTLQNTVALWGDLTEVFGKFIIMGMQPFLRGISKELTVLGIALESAPVAEWAEDAGMSFEAAVPRAESMLKALGEITATMLILKSSMVSVVQVVVAAWELVENTFEIAAHSITITLATIVEGIAKMGREFWLNLASIAEGLESLGGEFLEFLGLSETTWHGASDVLKGFGRDAEAVSLGAQGVIATAERNIVASADEIANAISAISDEWSGSLDIIDSLKKAYPALSAEIDKSRRVMEERQKTEALMKGFQEEAAEAALLFQRQQTEGLKQAEQERLNILTSGFAFEQEARAFNAALISEQEKLRDRQAANDAKEARRESLGALRGFLDETFVIQSDNAGAVKGEMDKISEATFGLSERIGDIMPEAFRKFGEQGKTQVQGLSLDTEGMLQRMGGNFEFLKVGATTALESLGVATEAWGEQFEAVALGAQFSAKAMSRAMRDAVSKQIATIAKDASIRALRSLAYGLFALGMGDSAGAGKFFAAAGKFGLLAGAAAVTARAVAPKAEEGAGAGGAVPTVAARREEMPFGPERRLAPGGVGIGAQRQFNINVIIEGNVVNNDQFVRDLSDTIKEAVGDNVQFGLVQQE